MSISGTFKAASLTGVVAMRSYASLVIEIEVEDLEIADAIKADEIVPEYDADELLDAIGETDVIEWLERNGYSVEKS